MSKDCRLCNPTIEKGLHVDKEKFLIMMCDSCEIPIIVLKEHREKLTLGELYEVSLLLFETFGDPMPTLRGYMKTIKDHWHDHINLGDGK